ncbi:hypothetical protein [Pseudomonas viridiflava]|uniref:hypothetical protein n=1 Tax=Pseudomonas viridiflava TaxID=33069 RepID=UPI001783BE91|nr:hypothetical protein [Pseudomonas viridiflava]MBD8201717.1 hypothetical protein [Pseudomonas viridiflava]
MKAIESLQFYLAISMVDLVTWQGDGDDDLEVRKEIQAVIELMGLDVDIRHMHEKYFFQLKVGQGDVYAFVNEHQPENFLAIDMYRGLTDQLDIVSIFVRSAPKIAVVVRAQLRGLFDAASCQVIYKEASVLPELQKLLDVRNHPFTLAESGYKQNLIVQRCG